MEVSSTSMNVASMTAIATSQGLPPLEAEARTVPGVSMLFARSRLISQTGEHYRRSAARSRSCVQPARESGHEVRRDLSPGSEAPHRDCQYGALFSGSPNRSISSDSVFPSPMTFAVHHGEREKRTGHSLGPVGR